MTDWDDVNLDEGLPRHVRMPVTVNGDGPAEGADIHRVGCWCDDESCSGPPCRVHGVEGCQADICGGPIT